MARADGWKPRRKHPKKVRNWLEHDVFPFIGNRPVSSIKPRDILAVIRRMETRGAIESAHRVKQVCGQICRYCVALHVVERDMTADLKGALKAAPRGNYSALTEPKDVAVLMRAIFGYQDFSPAVAALKLASLVFVRPGELRSAEWQEFDLEAAEWRIPAAKMKMKIEHMVPLSTQAVALLRGSNPEPADPPCKRRRTRDRRRCPVGPHGTRGEALAPGVARTQ